ncbi:TerC family protein [Frigidibacter sp. MR17.14]|uniref:TerC family protein n=1 Tax=Frigidibacter sp. MR17.14 TaxID=3126509 RepID=UPI003012DBB5
MIEGELLAFLKVVMIDIALAGDNAVVIGMATAALPAEQRKKAIMIGIGFAAIMRIALAFIATEMLAITGLTFAGGLLLLWVCWKLWRELRAEDIDMDGEPGSGAKTMKQAIIQVIIADISMSLDNVLAVAGAAQHHTTALIFGLALSVALMAVAANWIAGLLTRYKWIAYVGLAIILYVALEMIWHGKSDLPLLAHQMGIL